MAEGDTRNVVYLISRYEYTLQSHAHSLFTNNHRMVSGSFSFIDKKICVGIEMSHLPVQLSPASMGLYQYIETGIEGK